MTEARAALTSPAALARSPRMTRRRAYRILLALMWVIAFAVALSLDRHIAERVREAHPLNRLGWLAWSLKLPGYYPVTLAIAAILVFFHRRSWHVALPLILSGPLVGIAYTMLKWIVGRHRPVIPPIAPFAFHPFAHGLRGLIHAESGLSFPSGHTALAFATATCLAVSLPRWAMLFFVVAVAVGIERVLENAHYLSDVVAGAGVGILCAWAAMQLSAALLQERRPTVSSSV
jgi:membrane-associated phospholipid phosphatase